MILQVFQRDPKHEEVWRRLGPSVTAVDAPEAVQLALGQNDPELNEVFLVQYPDGAVVTVEAFMPPRNFEFRRTAVS